MAGRCDGLVGAQRPGRALLDGLPLLVVEILFPSPPFQLLRLLLRLFDEKMDKAGGDPELLGDVFLQAVRLLGGADDGLDLLDAEVLAVPLLDLGGVHAINLSLLPEALLGPALGIVSWLRVLMASASAAYLVVC